MLSYAITVCLMMVSVKFGEFGEIIIIQVRGQNCVMEYVAVAERSFSEFRFRLQSGSGSVE